MIISKKQMSKEFYTKLPYALHLYSAVNIELSLLYQKSTPLWTH